MKLTSVILLSALSVIAASSWVACSQVQFSAPNASTQAAASPTATPTTYDQTVTTDSSPIDILFVLDNSGSMSVDQRSLASKFSSFLAYISQADYHLAITTTDVSGTGLAGRDGTLVDFGGGTKYLTSSTANMSALFQAGVQRPESATCDQYLQTHNCAQVSCSDYTSYCASDDSRAIYAANLTVAQDTTGFLRTAGPLHVVILSNSDERVTGGTLSGRPMEANDLPASLKQTLTSRFGGKSLQVHTIIIRPSDTACWNQQYVTPLIYGQYAPYYSQLSDQTGGVHGTICASDYGNQLAQIGSQAATSLRSSLSLSCRTSSSQLTYTLSPSQSVTGTVDATGMILQFSSPLAAGTSVHLHYNCL